MTIYIARDSDGRLWLFESEPELKITGVGRFHFEDPNAYEITSIAFPNIKPGECVEFESKGAVT